ncbi:MAG: hypothetical protein Q9184_006449 [Pyrenodesmia sp. 2 TL-2023]
MIYEEIHRAYEEEYPDHRPISLPPRHKSWYDERFGSTIYESFFRPFDSSVFKKRNQGFLSQNVPALREASATIRAECDQFYLASKVLKFKFWWHGTELFKKDYFSKATIWIRRMSITMPPAFESHVWVKLFRKHEFENLQSLIVDFDHEHGYSTWSRYTDRLGDICYGPDCHVCPATIIQYDETEGKHSHKTMCKHLRKLRGLAQQLVRDLHAFERLTRLLAEKAPSAIIQLAVHGAPCPLCHDYCQLILESARTPGGMSVRPTLEVVLSYDDPNMMYRQPETYPNHHELEEE